MDVRRLADGLWYWTAPHPNWRNWPVDARDGRAWPERVGCVYYEAPDAVCLIDPLVPEDDEADFLRHLDGDVARLARPVVVLLTAGWHRRSANALAERYGAAVDPDPLPQGVEEIPIGGADERQVAYFIRPHRALVVAEIFAVDRSGTLGVYPSPALARREELLASLDQIAALPVERLLVSHGEPILVDASRAIEHAIAEAHF
jgi:hypothetical protein